MVKQKQIPIKITDPLAQEWYDNQVTKNLSINKGLRYLAKRFGTGDFIDSMVDENAISEPRKQEANVNVNAGAGTLKDSGIADKEDTYDDIQMGMLSTEQDEKN